MWEDSLVISKTEVIPVHWVLTVRKCDCGQTMYWDGRSESFHCMRPTCPLHKTHIKEIKETKDNIKRIRILCTHYSPEDVALRYRLPLEQIKRIIEK